MQISQEKQRAGNTAASFVEEGMVLGLGTGSTVAFFLETLGRKVRHGMKVHGVSTSEGTTMLCHKFGIELLESHAVERVDLTVDGADEIDSQFRMIKGGGGALFREKIVAELSEKVIIVIDSTKSVEQLGKVSLPIEVVRYGYQQVKNRLIKDLCMTATLRFNGETPYVTDNGNYILDCSTGSIREPEKLALQLKTITGVVESGLFVNHCDTLIIGKGNEVIIHSKDSVRSSNQ